MCKWCEHSIRKPWFDWYWCYMLAYSCQSLPIHQADTFRASAYTYIYIFELSILSLVVLWCLVQLCQCSICSITRRSSGWSALHPSLCSVTNPCFSKQLNWATIAKAWLKCVAFTAAPISSKMNQKNDTRLGAYMKCCRFALSLTNFLRLCKTSFSG